MGWKRSWEVGGGVGVEGVLGGGAMGAGVEGVEVVLRRRWKGRNAEGGGKWDGRRSWAKVEWELGWKESRREKIWSERGVGRCKRSRG